MSFVNKVILGALAIGLGCWAGAGWLNEAFIGNGIEGLYKIDGCFRDDEFGVTYQVSNAVKGQTFAIVIASDKYPKQEIYRIGARSHWPSNENKQKLYPIPCR